MRNPVKWRQAKHGGWVNHEGMAFEMGGARSHDCRLAAPALTGPHEFSHEHPVTPRQEIDTLCLRYASDDDDD
jgi:hypothetical protein